VDLTKLEERIKELTEGGNQLIELSKVRSTKVESLEDILMAINCRQNVTNLLLLSILDEISTRRLT